MNVKFLKVYYKAGVLVPFYASTAICIVNIGGRWMRSGYSWDFVVQDEFLYQVVNVGFYSGLICVTGLSAFLNMYRKIADSLLYSLLAWMLLPYGFIAYLMGEKVDWASMKHPGTQTMFGSTLLLVICFFHVIGIIIAYTDFRASVVLKIKAQKLKMNEKGQENQSEAV